MKDYRPGGTVTFEGVEYKIDAVDIRWDESRITTQLRTMPSPEVIEFTVVCEERPLR